MNSILSMLAYILLVLSSCLGWKAPIYAEIDTDNNEIHELRESIGVIKAELKSLQETTKKGISILQIIWLI